MYQGESDERGIKAYEHTCRQCDEISHRKNIHSNADLYEKRDGFMMKTCKNSGEIKFLCFTLILACAGFMFTPVLAEETITIDPVSYELIQTDKLMISGDALLKEEGNLLYDFYSEDSLDENGALVSKGVRYSSGMTVIQPKTSTKWYFIINIKDTPAGNYIFRIWKQGNEENKTQKEIYISPAMAEPAEKTPEPVLSATESYYNKLYYTTPGSGMELKTMPDLSLSDGRFAKGQSLLIYSKSVPEKEILIWIWKKLSASGTDFNKSLILKTDTEGYINGNNEILSTYETKNMPSGEYFIYAVSGTEAELSDIQNMLDSGVIADDILPQTEENNPYQKFLMLLEEPWIRFDNIKDGALPDAVTDTNSFALISGTTNLKPKTKLVIALEPFDDNSGLNKTEISGIIVSKGNERNTENRWTVKIDTASFNPGEYIVEIRDEDSLANMINTINILDKTDSIEYSENNSLIVSSYEVEQKPKSTAESQKSSLETSIPTIVIIFEGLLILCIIWLALRKV
ncbi:MAG: hypothetical protein PHV39_00610 [Methanomicrobium sp.]|nr:hypothetical protein [Methanomicrobium sp.]